MNYFKSLRNFFVKRYAKKALLKGELSAKLTERFNALIFVDFNFEVLTSPPPAVVPLSFQERQKRKFFDSFPKGTPFDSQSLGNHAKLWLKQKFSEIVPSLKGRGGPPKVVGG